jgi:ribosomal protein S18 acetylase RimI-like enzyme
LNEQPPGEVRRAGPRDLDRLAALWTALTEHHARLDPLFTLRDDAGDRVRSLLVAQLASADAAIFVFDDAGDLPGFCTVVLDRAPPILEEALRAEISDLGVREEARRRGIGRALVDAALAWVARRGPLRVEVRVATGNSEGQGFWRALGFCDHMDVLHRRL